MRPITAKKLLAILADNDFVLSRQKGSHQIFIHKTAGIMVAVPLHGRSRPIPIGTLLAIIKQSRIPKDKFVY